MKHVLAENDKSHFAVSRKSRLKFQNSQTDFVVKYSILLKNIFHSNDVSDLVLVLWKFQYFRWINKKVITEKVFSTQTFSFKSRFLVTFALQSRHVSFCFWLVIVKLLGSKIVYWQLLTQKSKPVWTLRILVTVRFVNWNLFDVMTVNIVRKKFIDSSVVSVTVH